jgi:hypothetical protein
MAATVAQLASEVYSAFQKKDVRLLRKINDRCIESIGMEFDSDTYNLAILSYVLSKILSKPRYFQKQGIADFLASIRDSLAECSSWAKKENERAFSASMKKTFKTIERLDSRDRRFVIKLQEKAKLKVASTLYAQGFSLGQASELTGIEKREILAYAGQTMMFDRVKEEKTIHDRLKVVRKIFG